MIELWTNTGVRPGGLFLEDGKPDSYPFDFQLRKVSQPSKIPDFHEKNIKSEKFRTEGIFLNNVSFLRQA
jgi:hypothetical protein